MSLSRAPHAFERVRQARGERNIAPGQRAVDLSEHRALVIDELAEQFQIQFPISRNATEAVLRIQAGDGWKLVRLWRGHFSPLRSRGYVR